MAGGCNCNQTCSCAMQSTDTVGIIGNGSLASPFRASAKISTDAGNLLGTGTDGALLVKTLLYKADGSTLLAVAPDGSIVLPAPCILDYNGNPIAPDGDGCIQLPTSGAPPDFACGLATEEFTGKLKVATTGDWPLTSVAGGAFGGASTDGGAIFCDDEGELRGLPDSTSVKASYDEDSDIGDSLLPVPTNFTTDATTTLSVINPSPARDMIVNRFVACTVEIVTPGLGAARVWLQENVNGGGWADAVSGRWPENQAADDPSIRFEGELSSAGAVQIGPGDSCDVQLRVRVQKVGAGDDDPVLFAVSMAVRLVGTSV